MILEMGQLGAAVSAMPVRRGQLGAANSTSGQFGVGLTRRRRFGGGHFDAVTGHTSETYMRKRSNERHTLKYQPDRQ